MLVWAANVLPRTSAIVLLVEHKECIVDRVEAGEQMKGSFVVVDADSAWITEDSISSVDLEVRQIETKLCLKARTNPS